ncbi:sialate O-acetylesterase [Brachionichthys hirsutus]|uniref:sialate O-acetylesterase n=1 Tax=Brachionichthys hirsutus TaxID=412623 RepID=UPI0036047169
MAATVTVVLILLVSIHTSNGELRFASYYGDNMVLQKSPESAVLWGYGPEGAQVTVSLSGPTSQINSSTAVRRGTWLVTLDPVEAGGPYNVTAATPSSATALTNVLFGDVWLCGGQSNMCFEMDKIFNASWELNHTVNYPHVRPFMVALRAAETELTDLIQVELPWSVPTETALSQFSAVCWLFGRYMYETLKHPIGLVQSCWGGTPVEGWSSKRALQRCGLGQKGGHQTRNSVLWNSMIHPLLKMTIKGAIWYQGESNTGYHQDQYSCSFPAMIDDWRTAFHQSSGGQTAPDFPFGFVQLSTYMKSSTSDMYPNIRWHQTADQGFVPNSRMQKTFMAVALDLPDETSPYHPIHPRDKQDVAYRLTLGARAVAYGEKDVAFLGPFPKQIQSSLMHVSVTYDQSVTVAPSDHIFEVCCSGIQAPCGPDFRWVAAPIVEWGLTTVKLSTGQCRPAEEAAALRYAWRDWPCDFKACPIYRVGEVLPAPPFIIQRYGSTGDIWKSE